MEHHFNVDIAVKYGMLEAVILNNIYFWIKKNEANDKNYHDGHYWTYNSAKAFHKLFPYASEHRIRNALKHLEEEGLIITGNYNQSAYDRTIWYALTENAISILQNYKMDVSKLQNQTCKNDTPIPYNNTVNKSDNIYREVPDYLKDAFMEWAEMRKKIKKPIPSEKSVTRALSKLYGLTKDKGKQIAIIEQATDKNWLSFYPLREDKQEQPRSKAYKEFEPEPEIEAVEMPDDVRENYNRFMNGL